MIHEEAAYWITLSHIPSWKYSRVNNVVTKFHHQAGISIKDFFQLAESDWRLEYDFSEKEIADLQAAKGQLAGNAFLAESLFNQGMEIIPIIDSLYPKSLKENLKMSSAPPVLYAKANLEMLKEKSIAIVGSREADAISLEFTDSVAKKASNDYKVVVSGFAKGVDRRALDAAIKNNGQSIIVLPQGINTFGSGFKSYYRQIQDGTVLVVSTFHPNVPWKVELAMARNAIIYGLADEIYVAQSSEKGGTLSGVIQGLKANRRIFIRKPDPGEINANEILIQKGGVPVDRNGVEIAVENPEKKGQKTSGVQLELNLE